MNQEFAPHRLDVEGFAAAGAQLQGQEPVSRRERLMAETLGRGGNALVAWKARGELRNPGHVQPEIWLHLAASTTLPLTCQRCLNPVDVALGIDRWFRFVSDEGLAAAQDEECEEDVLALSQSFDLGELIEDELLMDLPLAPRHEACPEPVSLSVADEEFEGSSSRRENPFAVLGKLKSGKS